MPAMAISVGTHELIPEFRRGSLAGHFEVFAGIVVVFVLLVTVAFAGFECWLLLLAGLLLCVCSRLHSNALPVLRLHAKPYF